jgi:hypothetical protein
MRSAVCGVLLMMPRVKNLFNTRRIESGRFLPRQGGLPREFLLLAVCVKFCVEGVEIL